jgi:hypothetical protein
MVDDESKRSMKRSHRHGQRSSRAHNVTLTVANDAPPSLRNVTLTLRTVPLGSPGIVVSDDFPALVRVSEAELRFFDAHLLDMVSGVLDTPQE